MKIPLLLLFFLSSYANAQSLVNILPHTSELLQMHLDNSGTRLMTYDRNGLLNIWDTEKSEKIYSTRILREGKYIYDSFGYNSFIIQAQYMDSLIGENFLLSDEHNEARKYLKENYIGGKMDENRKFIVSHEYPYKVLKIYDAETLALQKSLANPEKTEARYYFSENSDFISILKANDSIETYDTKNWTKVDSFYPFLDLERHQIYNFEKNCLLYRDSKDMATLYNLKEKKVISTFEIKNMDTLIVTSSHFIEFYLDVNRELIVGYNGHSYAMWDMNDGVLIYHSKHIGTSSTTTIQDEKSGNIYFSKKDGSLSRYNYLDGKIEYYDSAFLKLSHVFLNQSGSDIVSIIPKENNMAFSLDNKNSKPLETFVRTGAKHQVAYVKGNPYFEYGDSRLQVRVSSTKENLEQFFTRLENVDYLPEFQLSPDATYIFAVSFDSTYFIRLNEKDSVHVIPESFESLKYTLDQKSIYLSRMGPIEPPETPIVWARVLDLSSLQLGEYEAVDDNLVWSDRTITPSNFYYHKPYYIDGSRPPRATFVMDKETNSVEDTILYQYWLPKYWLNDSLFLLINSFDVKIRNQNLKHEILHYTFPNPNEIQSLRWKLDFCPEGKRFVIAKKNDGLYIYQTSSNSFQKLDDEHANNITYLRFLENGRFIIFVNAELLITKYDLEKKEVVSRWLYMNSDDRIIKKIMYPE